MEKELFDGALVVKDGDALAEALGKLPYLEVKRKNWKKERGHQWRVMVKKDMMRWWNRVKRLWGSDTIAIIEIQPDGENDWATFGEGLSPLRAVDRLPSFDAIREYTGVLGEHVDLEFDYKAKVREGLKQFGVIVLTVLAFSPFLWEMIQILPRLEDPNPWCLEGVVGALLPFAGWGLLGAALSFFVWHNLMVVAGLREGKWWIFASYFKKGMK